MHVHPAFFSSSLEQATSDEARPAAARSMSAEWVARGRRLLMPADTARKVPLIRELTGKFTDQLAPQANLGRDLGYLPWGYPQMANSSWSVGFPG